MVFDLIVVGGGAAGFYGAIQAAQIHQGIKVLILEKSGKLLSKVKVSGGGRCNVTHHCFNAVKLSQHYPRGEKHLRDVFKRYDARHTVAWFESHGVRLKAEADGRMFPVSDDSQSVIDCFLSETQRHSIHIRTGAEVGMIEGSLGNFNIRINNGETFFASRILIATGGSPKHEAYSFIRKLGHTIIPLLPSLFTFNDSEKKFSDLMGISVPKAKIRIATTKLEQEGPLLITHWGLSGPAVIKLSAWAAEYLHSVNYHFTVIVSWIGAVKEQEIREFLLSQKTARSKQKIHGHPLFELPQRLWTKLCALSEIPEDKVWGDVSHHNVNKLLEHLINCSFKIKGKTTFKEEFVTCGGVDLADINLKTMESKKVPGLFFAGEVVNIDGETGGFNFQAAWSTSFLAANHLSFA